MRNEPKKSDQAQGRLNRAFSGRTDEEQLSLFPIFQLIIVVNLYRTFASKVIVLVIAHTDISLVPFDT